MLNGTWYSTRHEGQCAPGQELGKDCWWRVKETINTVNATCVNNRLVANVQTKRPACWQGCPQPKNISSDCFIECLFETMIGNETSTPVVQPMAPADIIAPFVKAFAKEAEGGCPVVHVTPKPPTPAPPTPAPGPAPSARYNCFLRKCYPSSNGKYATDSDCEAACGHFI
jgi:hypothetical protein